MPLVFQSGTVLGTGDERSKTRCKVEEGPGAPVQPTTHRVPAHTLRDVDGRHPFKTLQAAESHGEGVWSFFVFVLCVVQRQAMVLFCSVTFHFFFFLSRLHVTFNVFSQVNGDIPPRLKKSAHEVILEFIRSRPPLNPVSRAEHGVSN